MVKYDDAVASQSMKEIMDKSNTFLKGEASPARDESIRAALDMVDEQQERSSMILEKLWDQLQPILHNYPISSLDEGMKASGEEVDPSSSLNQAIRQKAARQRRLNDELAIIMERIDL